MPKLPTLSPRWATIWTVLLILLPLVLVACKPGGSGGAGGGY